jgi:hypothetical protein
MALGKSATTWAWLRAVAPISAGHRLEAHATLLLGFADPANAFDFWSPQKNRRRDQSPPIHMNNCHENQASYFLTAIFFAGETAFFATFFAGAFFGVAFFTGAAFLVAGFAADFFAAGISYPPFHSAVAEDKKLMSLQFA